jgi:PAS domain S-box-containing protein
LELERIAPDLMSVASLRILLVDDDEIDRMAFLRFVRTQSLPYDCRAVGSVGEARAALAAGSFDLVILDRQLPDGLGFELLPYVGATPVIFATGSDSPEDAVRAMKEGATDYLLKDPDRNYLKLLPVAAERALRQDRDRAALRETQELFRQTFNEAPIGIAFVSPDGAFRRVNQALCKIFGFSEAEFLSGGFQRVFQKSPAPNCMAEFGGVQKSERLGRSADGREIWLQLDIVLVPDSRGLEPTYVAQFQDIGDRKRAEAALERSHAELVEASRRAGRAEVATGVLHNVANVLVSVNVASSLLAEGVEKSKTAHLKMLVAMIDEHKNDLGAFLSNDPKGKLIPSYLSRLSEHLAGERAAALRELAALRQSVEHLMAIVKAQQTQGKVGGAPEKLAVADFVTTALRMGSTAAHPGLQIVKEVGPELTVTVDKHQALQVLVNLIRNAIQACENSRQEEKVMTIRASVSSGRVRIAVTDNGVGIDPANLERIFSHGFTTKKDGHGFGLHSSVLVAKDLGGELSVHSDGPGKGATFTLELPL